MPNYETHLTAGALAGVFGAMVYITTLGGYFQSNDAVGVSLLMCAGVLVGSILPDIDHPDSIPRRLLDFYLCLGLAGGAFWFVFQTVSSSGLPSGGAAAVAVLPAVFVGALAAWIVPPTLDFIIPGHREIIHNPVFWASVLALPAVAIWKQALPTSIVPQPIGAVIVAPLLLAAFAGVMVHLSLDGISLLAGLVTENSY